MKDQLVSFLNEKEVLVSPEALEAILKDKEPLKLAEKLVQGNNFFVNLSDVQKITVKKPEPQKKPKEQVKNKTFHAPAKDIEPQIKEYKEYNVTGESTSKGQAEDFVALFNDRFEKLSEKVRNRGQTERDIATLKKRGKEGEVRVVGMVDHIKTTKNGHRFMIIEDQTDSLNALILERNKQLIKESYNIIPDEVIALEGKLSKDLFIVNKVYFPEIPARKPNRAKEEVYLAMISDTHIGSKLFLEKKFKKFLSWLNGKEGNEKHKRLAGKVKYLTIAGDLVDGVGVYPGQEEELTTENIFEQYERLAELLQEVPEHIEIVAIPGNHDATRIAEPQPCMVPEVLKPLTDLGNFRCLGNPGYVSLHGVEILMYHGASIHSMVPHIKDSTYEKPGKTIQEWLKRRHLHPVYGEKPPICPEKKDYMVIERVPDILHAGDVHKNDYVTYRGVLGVNSGTWQDITPFQIKQGHHPTPCILPIVNLKTGKLSVMHFEEGLN